MDIEQSTAVIQALRIALQSAATWHHEFVQPEHILLGLLQQKPFVRSLEMVEAHVAFLEEQLHTLLQEQTERVPQEVTYELSTSAQTQELLRTAQKLVAYADSRLMDVPHLVQAMMRLEDSYAAYLIRSCLNEPEDEAEWLSWLISEYDPEMEEDDLQEEKERDAGSPETAQEQRKDSWRQFVTCLNEELEHHNPLIGREAELEQTIRVLCRKDKNNPLHVGEPGVGKTSLAYGLAARIEAGTVPERLKGSRIYALDLGGMVAGTQYRGDFEKRLKSIMEGVSKEGKALVYIDEIHNLIGAGRTGDSAMDASNLLKPYLENGTVRFIGATTYEEYNRYMTQSKGLLRRFQQIDILEPSIEETIRILDGLKTQYETYHGVVYPQETLEWAARTSARMIHDRFLPDKAIDLLDEAGAWLEIHPRKKGRNIVDIPLLEEILSRICKVDAVALKEDHTEELAHLQERMKEAIFCQDEAVRRVVEAVQMAKAGLTDDNKPIASLLFVGPTGVGKTEVARVLAHELGMSLQRFDMSEYTEKHAVAKLIGSPAGYIGYEDGGLLTDAIRKTPNCVLLLDEIEKAHPDIFNILLQVMDYAMLTDNKGRKADCRHLILIMTSNAGAQYAHQASIGFTGGVSAGDAMMHQVRKTFKPEFLNRLSGTVIFHDMDHAMASEILNKKLTELNRKLAARQIKMTVSDAANNWLLQRSMTREYGAREMDRVIGKHLKPMLMREMLFGQLQSGGYVSVRVKEEELVLQCRKRAVKKETETKKKRNKKDKE